MFHSKLTGARYRRAALFRSSRSEVTRRKSAKGGNSELQLLRQWKEGSLPIFLTSESPPAFSFFKLMRTKRNIS